MKKALLSAFLPLALTLSGCAAYEALDEFVYRATTNPFLLLTGGKTLNHVMKWGYKNTYLSKLKGVHISELEKRGLIVSDALAESKHLYEIYSSYYGYGSGTTTNTYAVYADGSQELVNSHYDGGAIYFSVWLETDKNGIIVDYREEGNNPHELPISIRNKMADLLGEAPSDNTLDTRIIMVLNKTSGNWGVAVGGDNDNAGELIIKAFASCVSKDSGVPLNKLKTIAEIEALNKNDACKLADVTPPRALALFRNELANGGYEFHGAFSETDKISPDEFKKQQNDCQTEGRNCQHLRSFSAKDKGKVF